MRMSQRTDRSVPTNQLHKTLTVRLLVAGTSTLTTKLLGLAAAGIGHQESSVILNELLLDGALGGLVDV